MSFTNQALSTIGAVSGAVAVGKHLKNQADANKNMEANMQAQAKELEFSKNEAENAYNENTKQIETEAAGDVTARVHTENGAEVMGADEYLANQLKNKQLNYDTIKSSLDDEMKNSAFKKSKEAQNLTKDLEKAQLALDTVNEKIQARAKLKFNLDNLNDRINLLAGGKK